MKRALLCDWFIHYYVIIVLMTSLPPNQCLQTLRLAHVVYRHGDRAPSRIYPTDPNLEDAWPGGFGSLTQLGVEQQFQLGQYFRYYFDGFINSTYDSKQIYVRSTDLDRTLISAYSNLEGLYNDADTPVRNPLVPVHAPVPDPLDAMLNMNAECGVYSDLLLDVYNGEEVLQYQKDNADFLNMVRTNAGMSNATLWDIAHVIPNAVKLEKIHDMPQPEWVTEEVADKLWEIRELEYKCYVYTPKLTAIRTGLFYQEMNSHIQDYITGLIDRNKKIFFYSAHDSSIVAFLTALGLWDGLVPEFASSLFYELHERQANQFSIRVLYRNETAENSEPVVLQIHGCDVYCPIDTFNEITEQYTWHGTWKDWFTMCKEQTSNTIGKSVSSSQTYTAVGMTIVGIFGGSIILIAVIVSVGGYMKQNNKYRTYTSV